MLNEKPMNFSVTQLDGRGIEPQTTVKTLMNIAPLEKLECTKYQ